MGSWLPLSPRVEASFPKTAATPMHVEIRAGWRLRPESYEEAAPGDPSGGPSGGSDDLDENGPGDSGPLEVNLGLGINTGAGVRDGSLGVKLAGTGVQIGRKVGFSFFDNEISIDISKLWGGWMGGTPGGGGKAASRSPTRSRSPSPRGRKDAASATPTQADAAWELAQLKAQYEQKLAQFEDSNRAVLQRQMQQKEELLGSPSTAMPSVHAV